MVVGVGDVFKALADPTRRTILDELTERDGQTLFEICARLAMQARARLDPAGDLPAPRRARGRRAGHAPARGPLQVPPPRHRRRCEHDRRALADVAAKTKETTMRITVTSVFVDDQAKALRFYTDVLGLREEARRPAGRAPLADRRLAGRARRRRAAAGARPSTRRPAVQGGARRRRHPVHVVRASTTSSAEYERLRGLGVRSPSRRPTWGRSPRPCSTTPAATSSRSSPHDLTERAGAPVGTRCRISGRWIDVQVTRTDLSPGATKP